MNLSRRRFINSAFTLAGIGSLSPTLLTSCLQGKGETELRVDFIGSSEDYERYLEYFRGIRNTVFEISSVDRTLAGNSHIAFLDANPATRAAWILMLIDNGRDILTTYPLCNDLGDYTGISDFIEQYGRHVGMVNPLLFYPSLRLLSEHISMEGISLQQVRVSCHPEYLSGDFSIPGLTGTAQAFQGAVYLIGGSYPLSLMGEADPDGNLRKIQCRYEGFDLFIHFNSGQTGWNMEITGDKFIARADHTGMLALNKEVEPRIAPDPGVFDRAVRENLEDFLQAVRDRVTPRVNQIDGLSAMILENAVRESLESGLWVKL
jgi:predicted dehydrogenase